MHAKQERVGSLNYFNGTLFLTPVYLFFCHQNKSFYLSKQRLFRRHFFYLKLQPIKWVDLVRLHTGAVYIEEKAVYMDNIHDKTIQWEARKWLAVL